MAHHAEALLKLLGTSKILMGQIYELVDGLSPEGQPAAYMLTKTYYDVSI